MVLNNPSSQNQEYWFCANLNSLSCFIYIPFFDLKLRCSWFMYHPNGYIPHTLDVPIMQVCWTAQINGFCVMIIFGTCNYGCRVQIHGMNVINYLKEWEWAYCMKNGSLINTEHGKLIPEIRSQKPFEVCFGLAWHAFESRAFDQINDIRYF